MKRDKQGSVKRVFAYWPKLLPFPFPTCCRQSSAADCENFPQLPKQDLVCSPDAASNCRAKLGPPACQAVAPGLLEGQ